VHSVYVSATKEVLDLIQNDLRVCEGGEGASEQR
jgi:hypothetical protein